MADADAPPLPDADPGLAALLARAATAGRRPPVERWTPPFCGDIDMRIDRDGRWHYRGSPIGREALVRLFAGILRHEDGRYFLVTPVEKVGIRVDDVPFLAVEMHVSGSGPDRAVTLRTNVGDVVTAGAAHAFRFALAPDGGFVPYVAVRDGLEARLTRALAVDLAELLEERDGRLGLQAGGVFHALPPDALEGTT